MKSQIVVLAVAVAVVLAAGSVQAVSVFNMGGTRDPTTGTWTGSASLDMVTVGNSGNAADPATGSIYGSVPYVYQIGKYDVTVGQYCQFLNAVAKTDPYSLYNGYIATYNSTINITQSGSSGNYSYAVAGGYSQGANCPIFGVTWGDAARFCNWLQNGQAAGAEGAGTTEAGAYTLNGDTTTLTETRNAGAKYVIPSENEWYKAAYYDPTLSGGAGGYWAFPTKSNNQPGNSLPDAGNSANYGNSTDPTNLLTPVGAFAASPGPYGTYDMGGDVYQWNEAVFGGVERGLRGGCWDSGDVFLRSDAATYGVDFIPTNLDGGIGFRVASIPEPGSVTLLLAGALSLLAYALRRRCGDGLFFGFQFLGDKSPVFQGRRVMFRGIRCFEMACVSFFGSRAKSRPQLQRRYEMSNRTLTVLLYYWRKHACSRTTALMVFPAVLILAVSTAGGETMNMVNYPNSQNGCIVSGTVVGSGGGTNDEGSITSSSQISTWDITITPSSGPAVILTPANSSVTINSSVGISDDSSNGYPNSICLETYNSESGISWKYSDTGDVALNYMTYTAPWNTGCVYSAQYDNYGAYLFGGSGGNVVGPGEIATVGGLRGNLIIASTGPVGVPEPGSIALLITGAISLIAYAWRRQRQVNRTIVGGLS